MMCVGYLVAAELFGDAADGTAAEERAREAGVFAVLVAYRLRDIDLRVPQARLLLPFRVSNVHMQVPSR